MMNREEREQLRGMIDRERRKRVATGERVHRDLERQLGIAMTWQCFYCGFTSKAKVGRKGREGDGPKRHEDWCPQRPGNRNGTGKGEGC